MFFFTPDFYKYYVKILADKPKFGEIFMSIAIYSAATLAAAGTLSGVKDVKWTLEYIFETPVDKIKEASLRIFNFINCVAKYAALGVFATALFATAPATPFTAAITGAFYSSLPACGIATFSSLAWSILRNL